MNPDTIYQYKKLFKQTVRAVVNKFMREDVTAQALLWEVKGADLSYWQGNIDFAKLATMVDFVFIRAGYGNDFIDPRVDEYRKGCKEYNIPFGVYWYVKAGKNFETHAKNFHLIWSEDPGKLPPVFDLEETGGLAKSALESWWQKMYNYFLGLADLTLEDVVTYTSPGFMNKAIGLTSWLKNTLLWVAHWTSLPVPTLPLEWANKTWKFWQWTATARGKDYGVSSTYIDLNRYNGTKEQFEKEFMVVLPPPDEEDMKYRVMTDGLKIRSTPVYLADDSNVIGIRVLGSIVTPMSTVGDATRARSYWVQDNNGGWSAAQWSGAVYMQPFI